MFSWLLGLPFIGAAITILTPAFKGIVEGLVGWIKAMWHGVKTSNYGTWTLIFTVAGMVYMFTPCPETRCVVKEVPSKHQVGKTSNSTNPKDTFLDSFRLW